MPKKLTAEEIKKLKASFLKQRKRFRKAWINKNPNELAINEEVSFFYRIKGKNEPTIKHQAAYVVKYITEKMTKHRLPDKPESSDPVTADILTGRKFPRDPNDPKSKEYGVYLKNGQVMVEYGSYGIDGRGDDEGYYTILWVHQDDCWWEAVYFDFRDNL